MLHLYLPIHLDIKNNKEIRNKRKRFSEKGAKKWTIKQKKRSHGNFINDFDWNIVHILAHAEWHLNPWNHYSTQKISEGTRKRTTERTKAKQSKAFKTASMIREIEKSPLGTWLVLY